MKVTPDSVLGRSIFDLAGSAETPEARERTRVLRDSLEQVVRDRVRQVMPAERRPPAEAGGLWQPVNSPVMDAGGQLIGIVHWLERIVLAAGPQPDDPESRREDVRGLRPAPEARERFESFLAVWRHEIQNAFSAALGGLAVMRLNPDRREEIEPRIERQLEQAQALVRQLGEVVDIGRGVIELRKETTPVNPLLEAAAACSWTGDEPSLTWTPLAVPLEVDGDPSRLEQILAAMTAAAVSCAADGGPVRLSAARAPDGVRVQCSWEGARLGPERLRDCFDAAEEREVVQGRGRLGPERLRDCFDLPGEGRYDGGVLRPNLQTGLAIARTLAELHGGSLTAAEREGGGGEFVLRLPLSGAPAESGVCVSRADASPDAAPSRRAGRRMLLIEDHRELAGLTADLLRRQGHEVRVALSAEEGIGEARKHLPEVVLCDLNLPTMRGFEVVRLLRGELSTAVFIGVTAGPVEGFRAAKDTPFDEFLSKPLTGSKVENMLERIFRR